jgi:hypothetical protein
MISSITDSSHHFLSHALNVPHPLPNHLLFIAFYPARDRDVGLLDPVKNAIALYVIPLTRSTHCTQHGIPLKHDQLLVLPSHHANSLKNWKAKPLRLFKILGHCLPPILRILTQPKNTPPKALTFVSTAPRRKGMLRNLCCTHEQHERVALTPTYPPHVQVLLLQLLNKQTSFPFHSLSGCQKDHQMAPATCSMALNASCNSSQQ